MNKNIYRVVFHQVGITALCCSMTAVNAQIVAYRNAPGNQRPTVLQAGNGVPLVNIQTPSAQGVSRNVYSQFDVHSNGVILNNASASTATALGGWVQGNPWLALGTARVIVNEINSANPSQLRGYIEVAGDRAHVIVANPAGLMIDGGGFLNASRATLTTGVPDIVNGNLDAYRVSGGVVSIDGKGLDAASTAYTDIMARAVQINAGLWANDLQVTTGVNTISAGHHAVTPAGAAAGAAPRYAIDVAQLGGMYSGKITLVGTEHGVGMNNAGAIGAGAGDVVVTVDGMLINKGSLTATQHLRAHAAGLTNQGQFQAGGSTALALGAGRLDNTGGLIRSQSATTVAAGEVINAGTQGNNQGIEGQSVAISAHTINNRHGAMRADTQLSLTGATITDNTGGLLRANDAASLATHTLINTGTRAQDRGIEGQSVHIAADRIDNQQGAMRANTRLLLSGSGAIDNTGGLLSSMQHTAIEDSRTGSSKTQTLTNTGGTLIGGRQLFVDSAAMSGDGNALSQGDLTLRLDAGYLHTGLTQADGNATISTAGTLINRGKLLAGNTLAATAASIDNQATGQIIADTNVLRATGSHTFTNRGLIDGSNTFIDSPVIHNIGTGRLYGDHVALSGTTLNNLPETVNGVTSAPVIAARTRMDLGVATIRNSDQALLYSAGDLATGNALDASHEATGMGQTIHNSSATIAADGNATISHQHVNNLNAHLQTDVETSAGRRIVQYRLNGATDKLDSGTVRLVHKDSGQILSDWRQMGDEDNFRLVLPSADYPFERYGAAFYRVAYTPASSTGGGDNPVIYYPEVYAYQPTDRIWETMGVRPPASDKLAGPEPIRPGGMVCAYDNCQYVAPTAAETAAWQAAYDLWKPARDLQQARYAELDQAIARFNASLGGRMVAEWTIYDGTEKIERTRVLNSDPAMIQVGGNLHFNSQSVHNANSQIIAGGDHTGDNILGTRPVNTGITGTQTVTTTGSAAYTYIKSHSTRADDRRYDTVAYEGQSVQTSFALDITPTGGSGAQQDKTLKAVLSSVPGDAQGGMVVRTSNPGITLPGNALFVPGNNRYLIATDPQFTSYRNWLSSDFMLTQMRQDPDQVLKRLGDGFYEQQLVQQQIQKAIGQRYTGNYTSNEAQYQALMNAGVQMARTFRYQVGVALTAAQMAMLTSDIVWLVSQTVTLADGSTQEVLVPQVYLRANRLQVTGEGTLMAGSNVNYQSAGDILNSGTIAAQHSNVLAGNNIDNLGGRISGNDTLLMAATDLNNLGGAIDGLNSVTATAGRDLNVSSTSVTTANATTTGTNINSVASITGNSVTLAAGRDLSANAAVIDATGNASLSAVRDASFGTLSQHFTEQIRWADDQGGSNWISALTGPNFVDQANGAHGTREAGVNRATLSASQDAVTRISGHNIAINAGGDLSTRGTQVTAAAALAVIAGNHLSIGTANASASARDQHQKSFSGILSSASRQTDDAGSNSRQLGSTLSGNTTLLAAGNNATITGSDVVSAQGTQITAVNDLTIDAATDRSSESHYRKDTTSGVFTGGGLGVTVGSKMQSTSQTHTATTASGSLIGATHGNVDLAAGRHYSQIASTVIAPQGDLRITGQQVDILAGSNTEQNTQETQFRQQGVTVQITNPVVSAVQTMMSMQQAKDKTKNGRVKVLADAATALAAANAAVQVAGSAAPAGGIDLAFSIGSSSNQSNTVQRGTTTAGSTVAASGTTIITATGAGKDSNLTIGGSEVSGENVTLQADNRIDLLAHRNTNEEHSTNQGSSASIGFSAGSSGVMVNASASGSRGKGDGSDSGHTNTHVSAASQLAMHSGGDTTIKGATAAGRQVTATVGGNLNVESLQDTSSYHSKQQSLGGSISAGAGVSASINASRSKVDGNYQSVIEQSGILAGDSGFNVRVNGHTDLKGGKIASTDNAVHDGKNSFTTASLTTSGIENRSEYQAQSQSMSAGGGYNGSNSALNGTGIGLGNDSGSASSVTTAGISGMAGDTTVRSDKDSSNALVKNWDGKQLQQDVEAQAKITETFGKQAALGIGTYATLKLNNLSKQIDKETDPVKIAQLQSEMKNWGEGGTYRTALHAAAGALGGGLAGAAGATASSVSMPAIAEMIDRTDAPHAVKQALAQVAAAALGAAVGGTAGLASAVNVEANNRQLHQSERDFAKQNAKKFAQHYEDKTGLKIDDGRAEQILLGNGYRMVDAAASKGPGVAGSAEDAIAVSFIAQNAGNLFKATAAERNNPFMNGNKDGSLTPEQAALPGAKGNPVLGLATAGLVTGGVALAGAGTAATIAGAVDAWATYRAASAAYSMGAALGTGAVVGGASYTGSAIYAGMRTDQGFNTEFDHRFSYSGLGAAMTVGGLTGMYSTAMFGWAGIPNSIMNLATIPGLVIRVNSSVAGKVAGSAAQGAINSSAKP